VSRVGERPSETAVGAEAEGTTIESRITNSDKLEHLGPVLDAREILRRNRR